MLVVESKGFGRAKAGASKQSDERAKHEGAQIGSQGPQACRPAQDQSDLVVRKDVLSMAAAPRVAQMSRGDFRALVQGCTETGKASNRAQTNGYSDGLHRSLLGPPEGESDGQRLSRSISVHEPSEIAQKVSGTPQSVAEASAMLKVAPHEFFHGSSRGVHAHRGQGCANGRKASMSTWV